MRFEERDRHPLEKVIEQLAITRADLHEIAGRRAVIDCLSTPGAPLAPKLAEWLVSVGVNLERFNVQVERYWGRVKHRNEAL